MLCLSCVRGSMGYFDRLGHHLSMFASQGRLGQKDWWCTLLQPTRIPNWQQCSQYTGRYMHHLVTYAAYLEIGTILATQSWNLRHFCCGFYVSYWACLTSQADFIVIERPSSVSSVWLPTLQPIFPTLRMALFLLPSTQLWRPIQA